MKKVAIITDSNSGYDINDEREGLYVLPMPFIIEEKEYVEGVSLDKELFYKFMDEGKKISTVQPPVADILIKYQKVLEKYDEILCVPMSSALSNTYQTCITVAEHMGEGRIQVADSRKISVSLKRNIQDAMELIKQGLSAKEIKNIMEAGNDSMKAYVALETLKYLRSGGRGSAALVAIGTLLKIKPVAFLGPGKVEPAVNLRTMNQAREWMIEQTKEIIAENPEAYYIDIVHTNNPKEADKFKDQLVEALDWNDNIMMEELTLSIATHVGPGALAVAITDKLV